MPRIFTVKKEDASKLLDFTKGIAILLIMFHHFSRSIWLSQGLLPPLDLQWNFYPMGERYTAVAATAHAGSYSDLCVRLMAQFGYVGVHLFVLISGLGLALGTAETSTIGPFMKRRICKIVPPFWLAIAYFSILAAVVGQPFSVGVIFERMFMLTTFDQRQFFIIDSPMWCLAVFFQLYLIFLPLRKLIVRVGPISLLPLAAIGFAARWIAGLPSVVRWDEFFGHTMVFNWLFVFGLGIWIGTKLRQDGEIRFPLWTVSALPLAATGVLILSEKFHSVYPIHDSVIGLVMGVVAFYVWQAARGTPVASVLAVVGAISFPLYLYHRPLVSYATNIWCLAPSIDRMPPLQLGIFLVPAILLLFLMIPRIVYFRKQAFAMIFALLSLH